MAQFCFDYLSGLHKGSFQHIHSIASSHSPNWWLSSLSSNRDRRNNRLQLFPILNILVPQVGHTPWVAGFPFFIVMALASLISFLVRHFIQYACIGLPPFLIMTIYYSRLWCQQTPPIALCSLLCNHVTQEPRSQSLSPRYPYNKIEDSVGLLRWVTTCNIVSLSAY